MQHSKLCSLSLKLSALFLLQSKQVGLFYGTGFDFIIDFQAVVCQDFRSAAFHVIFEYIYISKSRMSRGCQGGAVGRGLGCQSCGWQIESQLCQIDKKPSTRFHPYTAGLDQDLNLKVLCTTIISWAR